MLLPGVGARLLIYRPKAGCAGAGMKCVGWIRDTRG
jgi:hypothetical protein